MVKRKCDRRKGKDRRTEITKRGIIIIARCLWNEHRLGRMLQWGVISIAFYVVALVHPWPLVFQAALTKAANVNLGAFLGYWLDRTLFKGFDLKHEANPKEISNESLAARVLSRGIIVGACVIGFAAGVGA